MKNIEEHHLPRQHPVEEHVLQGTGKSHASVVMLASQAEGLRR